MYSRVDKQRTLLVHLTSVRCVNTWSRNASTILRQAPSYILFPRFDGTFMRWESRFILTYETTEGLFWLYIRSAKPPSRLPRPLEKNNTFNVKGLIITSVCLPIESRICFFEKGCSKSLYPFRSTKLGWLSFPLSGVSKYFICIPSCFRLETQFSLSISHAIINFVLPPYYLCKVGLCVES